MHGRYGQRTVEMRKQIATARGLEAERIAEIGRAHGQQHKIGAPTEMLFQRARQLVGKRKMNEAIALVVGRSGVHSGCQRTRPGVCAANFIHQIGARL